MTEIRVPGLSRLLAPCIRDFPPGCGPNAVFIGRNPDPEPVIIPPSKPVENGFSTPERNSQISVPGDVVVDAVPLAVVEAEAVCEALSDVGKRQMDFVEEGALMIIDNARICNVKAGVEGAVLSNGVLPSAVSGGESGVVVMSVKSETEESLSFSDWKAVTEVKDDVGMGKDGCEEKDVDMDVVSDGKGKEGAIWSNGASPLVISEKENGVVTTSAVSELTKSLSFSGWKAAPAVTNEVGNGKDGFSEKDADMDVVSDGKGKEVVVVAGPLKEAVGLSWSECSQNGLELMEGQVRKDKEDGSWNVAKECYSRKYPPPRAVSAIRDFPIGCGPNLPLQSGEECLRNATELALSRGKKNVERSPDVADQKPARAMVVPAEVPVDNAEKRDKANDDSSSRSKTSCVGVPMIDHQEVDLAICQAISDIPLDQIDKWNDEANKRENTTQRVSHEAPVQNRNLENHHLSNTISEFGSKTFVGRGKIPARKSTNKFPEKPVISIKKRKFNDGVKNEQGMINNDLEYPKLDANGEKYIVQGLMAAEKCPWRLTEKQGASSSRSPYVKAKRKEATDTKQLALNEIEDEESNIKVKSKNTSNAKKLAFSRMKDEKPHVKVKTREKSETKETAFEDDENSTSEAERAPVVYQPTNEFSITLPPVTPITLANGDGSSEDITARQKVKRVLKQFNALFRKLLHQVESKPNSGKMRIDLLVADKLKEMGAFVNKDSEGIIGDVPGVEVGDEFGYRVELAVVGLHRLYQGGIDFAKRDGMNIALSVVASGGYQDDMEDSDELVYTGSGGKPASAGKEAEDQKLERGNLALKNSIDKRTPVRVIHGFKEMKAGLYGNGKPKAISTFTYAGLYYVDDYWQEKGKDDYLEFKFKLVRVPGQPLLALHQVKQSKKSEVREGQCVADISQGKERFPICAINTEDDDQPQPFKYITKRKYPSSFARVPAKGCDCTGGCKDSGNCSCASKNGGEIPYNFNGAIVQAKRLVYECGPACKCSKSCPNRVSQHGIRIPLEIFKTKSRGWGVRSLSSITSGTFICEYIGELIEDKEAEKRSNDEYFFDIGNNYEDNTVWEGIPDATPSPLPSPSDAESRSFTIDAAEYANVGRFINHSCSPNLYAQNVIYDHDDRRMPHIMFFAAENIPPLQELTYHYNYAVDQVHDADGNIKKKDCYCGSEECTGRLY